MFLHGTLLLYSLKKLLARMLHEYAGYRAKIDVRQGFSINKICAVCHQPK